MWVDRRQLRRRECRRGSTPWRRTARRPSTRNGVAVVRAPAEWRERSAGPRPDLRDVRGVPRAVGGASVGPLSVLFESAAGTLWLGERSLSLGGANVALVGVDVPGDARLAGAARVAPALGSTGARCQPPLTEAERAALRRALLAAIRSDSAARAFLGRDR